MQFNLQKESLLKEYEELKQQLQLSRLQSCFGTKLWSRILNGMTKRISYTDTHNLSTHFIVCEAHICSNRCKQWIKFYRQRSLGIFQAIKESKTNIHSQICIKWLHHLKKKCSIKRIEMACRDNKYNILFCVLFRKSEQQNKPNEIFSKCCSKNISPHFGTI